MLGNSWPTYHMENIGVGFYIVQVHLWKKLWSTRYNLGMEKNVGRGCAVITSDKLGLAILY